MTDEAHRNIYLDNLLPGSFLYEYPGPFQFHHVSEVQIHQYKYEPVQQPKKEKQNHDQTSENVVCSDELNLKKINCLSAFQFTC